MTLRSATSENDSGGVVNQLSSGGPSMNSNSRDGSNQSDEASASIKLEEAIREVVREELGRPAAPSPPPDSKPTLADAFWWFLCVVDVGLLIWWIPENLLSNKKLDFFIKSVAWVGSYLFLLGYAWFRNQFLAFSRRRAFKIVMIVLLLVLVPFYFSLLPIFQIRPLVEPENAELIVDGNTENKQSPQNLRLSLGKHDITVTEKTDSEKSNTREFKLSYMDFVRTWWSADYRPHWPLLYVVPITVQEPGVEIVIQKQGGDFDPDFISKKRRTSNGAPIEVTKSERPVLSFYGPDLGVDVIELPYGKYEVFARKAGCGQTEPQLISSWNAGYGAVFEEVCK